MSIVIEKGIPAPKRREMRSDLGRSKKAIRQAAETMDVGDSFLVPPERRGKHVVATYLTNQNFPKQFTGRACADGYRVWRVA